MVAEPEKKYGRGSNYRFRRIDIEQYARMCEYNLDGQLNGWLVDGLFNKINIDSGEARRLGYHHQKIWKNIPESPRSPNFLRKRRNMLYEMLCEEYSDCYTISPMDILERIKKMPNHPLYSLYENGGKKMYRQVHNDLRYLLNQKFSDHKFEKRDCSCAWKRI